jgi:hypothetical protein
MPSREEVLLRASIEQIQAQRAGKPLASNPAAAPQTSNSRESTEEESRPEEHHTRVTQGMAEQLAAPLPPEAIDQHPTKAYLSTIKTIFSIERLNQVFGLDGWTYKTEIVENAGSMIVVKVILTAGGIVREQFGGNDNSDRGDAYKGAVTDALSKICSYLGIGMDVYKGHGPTKGNNGRRPQPKPELVKPPAPRVGTGDAGSRPPSPPVTVTAAKPWSTFNGMLDEFRKVEALLPADFFAAVLHEHGVDSAEDFRKGPTKSASQNSSIATACYQKLLHAAAEYQARELDPRTFEHFQATEGAWA